MDSEDNMKVRCVRVTRTRTLEITETVDIPFAYQSGSDAEPPTFAEMETGARRFVEASVAIGKEIPWRQVTEREAKYSHTDYGCEVVPEPGMPELAPIIAAPKDEIFSELLQPETPPRA